MCQNEGSHEKVLCFLVGQTNQQEVSSKKDAPYACVSEEAYSVVVFPPAFAGAF